MAFDFYYSALSTLFSPLMGLHPAIAEMIIAAIIVFIITLFYKFLVDQKKLKEIRDQVKEMQKKSKEMQKENPEKAKEITSEMLGLTNKQMKMTMKPILVTLLFVFLIFPWLRTVFMGPVVMLPFRIPWMHIFPFEFLWRDWFGWFMWYVLCSLPLSILFRKFMGVV